MTAPASGQERAVVFECGGDGLVGVLHPPSARGRRRGVLIVVGGPQYRVGSHRQYVLLARELAAAGYATFRFDYRGVGDSEGSFRGFTAIEYDIGTAIDAFVAQQPEVEEIVLCGLCDAASAAAFYGYRDSRVGGIVLLNPWVRTEAGEARARVRHYYRARLMDPAFWRKVARLRLEPFRSAASLLDNLRRSRAPRGDQPLPERMGQALAAFDGRVLLLLSGNDLVAREFEDTASASSVWRHALASPRFCRERLADADHTFSRAVWRDEVARLMLDWLDAA